MLIKKLIPVALTALSLVSCVDGTTMYRNELPPIYPDYIGVTVPAGIAPMDFNLTGDWEKIFVEVSCKGGKVLSAKGRYARFNIRRWRKAAANAIGDTLTFTVLGRKDGLWTQFHDFPMYVSSFPLDDYGITYRKFAPGYETYSQIGIYQRNIHNFKETPIIEGSLVPGQCVGCHTANAASPDQFLFHVRGTHGATFMQLEGRGKWLNTKTDSTISNAVYSYWHPSGDFVAHSNNLKISQMFWTGNNGRYIEVFDNASDVIVHNVRTDEYILSPLLMTDDFETYPAFSPDGKTLYYCSAPKTEVPENVEDVHYNLCSVAFDAATQTIGERADTLINAYARKKSVTFPRPSFDGRWILYSYSDFGNFPINHKESDLWLMDLSDGSTMPLWEANSDSDESFHNWSSNSHWILFSSRRDDGQYSQVYFCSIDENGRATKPFVLPQRNPLEFYHSTLFTFNVPDFTGKKVKFAASKAFKDTFSDKRIQVKVKK